MTKDKALAKGAADIAQQQERAVQAERASPRKPPAIYLHCMTPSYMKLARSTSDIAIHT